MVTKTEQKQTPKYPILMIEFPDGPLDPQVTCLNWTGIALGHVERAMHAAIRAAHQATVATRQEATAELMFIKETERAAEAEARRIEDKSETADA